MATIAQFTANRDNSQLSTGPRTPDGKAASSRNSFRHGLTAEQIVLSNEDPTQFDELRHQLHAEHVPAGTLEAALVDQVAQNLWRLLRAQRVEREVAEAVFVAKETDAAASYERILRYLTTAERAFHKSVSQLRDTQSSRKRATADHVRTQAARASIEADRHLEQILSDPSTGFVPQIPLPPSPMMPRSLKTTPIDRGNLALRL